jgi:regulator of sigma E protease
VGVAVMTGEAARLGWGYLLQFTALLSLNLAVINILPIPALDGGRLLFVLIGRVFNRSIAPKVEQVVHSVGFILLMLLVVTVTVKDIGAFKDIFTSWWHGLF